MQEFLVKYAHIYAQKSTKICKKKSKICTKYAKKIIFILSILIYIFNKNLSGKHNQLLIYYSASNKILRVRLII